MLDQTAISVFLFAVIKYVMWAGLIFWFVAIARRIRNSSGDSNNWLWPVLLQHRSTVVLWVAAFTLAVMVHTLETAYRPKTVLAPRNQYHEQRLKEERPPGKIMEAPTRPSWEDIQEKNKKENKETRRAFESLPDAK